MTWTQHTATYCNKMQRTTAYCNTTHCNILQHAAAHCNIRQHIAECTHITHFTRGHGTPRDRALETHTLYFVLKSFFSYDRASNAEPRSWKVKWGRGCCGCRKWVQRDLYTSYRYCETYIHPTNTAIHFNAKHCNKATHCNTVSKLSAERPIYILQILQHTSYKYCNTLQRETLNTLQHTATPCQKCVQRDLYIRKQILYTHKRVLYV